MWPGMMIDGLLVIHIPNERSLCLGEGKGDREGDREGDRRGNRRRPGNSLHAPLCTEASLSPPPPLTAELCSVLDDVFITT